MLKLKQDSKYQIQKTSEMWFKVFVDGKYEAEVLGITNAYQLIFFKLKAEGKNPDYITEADFEQC